MSMCRPSLAPSLVACATLFGASDTTGDQSPEPAAGYDELISRDKPSLDITRLKPSLEPSDNLPEISEDSEQTTARQSRLTRRS